MNILAIDYGEKNIGLAWADTGIGAVLPYGTIKNQSGLLNDLAKLISEEKIDKVVIGLPLGLENEENRNTKLVRTFVDELKKKINVEVGFLDERFTSAAADRMEVPEEGTGASRDEKAAMVILQSYIDGL